MQEPQKVRINKLLSQAGVASRREAEKLIHAGSVILNGKTVTEPGQTMLPGTDHLTVEGRKIRFHQAPKTKVYALYKPRNCPVMPEDCSRWEGLIMTRSDCCC